MNMGRIVGMIGGGLIMALLLYVGLVLADRRQTDEGSNANGADIAQEASLRPVTFTTISESGSGDNPELRLQGQAEPGSVIVLLNRGDTVRQVRTDDMGEWTAAIDIPPEPMAIEAVMFDGNADEDRPNPQDSGSISIRGVETIFHIRRPTADNPDPPALILISSPGAASRLIQSPFGGLPGSGETGEGPLFIGPIDYDDAGGVIFSGLSSVPGRVRLYVANSAIGDTRIGPDGRWAYIASSVMPLGEYDVRAELIGAGETRASVSVPFERMPPLPESSGDDGALSVSFEPFQWQIRRSLIGGGSQSTVIFSPEP